MKDNIKKGREIVFLMLKGDTPRTIQSLESEIVYVFDYEYEMYRTPKRYGEVMDLNILGCLEDEFLIIPEPILTMSEKEYLNSVIKPFRDDIEYIYKCNGNDNGEYIEILFKDVDKMSFKYFKKGTRYKGMKINKKYTLKELELDEDIYSTYTIEQKEIYDRLKNFAKENNNREIDWRFDEEEKYTLVYDYYYNKVDIRCDRCNRYIGSIYFTSKKVAEQAIEEIGADNIIKLLKGV